MIKHTPEPWSCSDSPYGSIISNATPEIRHNWCMSTGDTGRKYSNELAVANAMRIAECVNACTGMKNPKEEINFLKGRIKSINKSLCELYQLAGSEDASELILDLILELVSITDDQS